MCMPTATAKLESVPRLGIGVVSDANTALRGKVSPLVEVHRGHRYHLSAVSRGTTGPCMVAFPESCTDGGGVVEPATCSAEGEKVPGSGIWEDSWPQTALAVSFQWPLLISNHGLWCVTHVSNLIFPESHASVTLEVNLQMFIS